MNDVLRAFEEEQDTRMKERKELIEISKTLTQKDHDYLISVALQGSDDKVHGVLYESLEKQGGCFESL